MEGALVGLESYICEPHCLSETGPILPLSGGLLEKSGLFSDAMGGVDGATSRVLGKARVQVQVFLSQKETSVIIFGELQSRGFVSLVGFQTEPAGGC